MNNQPKLTFRFDDDGDGTGQFVVEANSNGFAGRGAAYLSKSYIEKFADSLQVYPLRKENLPELSGGLKDPKSIFIKVYPTNGVGDLGMQIKLATEFFSEARFESYHTVQLEILTHYQPLADLSKELKDLINGRTGQATLQND